ncbi:MAG: substrate-binding domain-containing protein [Nitrospira sp.]
MKCSQLAFIVCVIAIPVQGGLPPESLAQVRATIDPDIPSYIAQDSVSGRLTISTPETMKPLVEAWAGDLIRQHPDLNVTVIREDPDSGLAALLERRAEIAAMSRRITPTEIAEFIFEYGYVPMEVPVARHASTVFVHNDNRNTNFVIPSKVDRLHHVRRNLYLYITSPSRSNPTPATAELVHYALSRQGQELVLGLGHSPLSYAEIARVNSKWLACCKLP